VARTAPGKTPRSLLTWAYLLFRWLIPPGAFNNRGLGVTMICFSSESVALAAEDSPEDVELLSVAAAGASVDGADNVS